MNKELYKNKVREFCNLLNASDLSTKPTAQAIFERIEGRFTDDDMVRAFDDMVETEVSKLTYPALKRHLIKYRDIRISAEQQRRKLQERTDIDAALSHDEIKKIVNSIIDKKLQSTAATAVKPNAVYRTIEGKMLSCWIDPDDSNMEPGKAVTIIYEQRGDQMVRTQHINLSMVNHRIFTKRPPDRQPERRSPRSMLAPPILDDDFIPELEVDENAYQGTLNVDKQTGRDA